jgi:hypothetical protein
MPNRGDILTKAMNVQTIICLVILFLFMIAAHAWGADWKYLGSGNESKNKVIVGFYDAESVEYNSDGNVRAWNKSITESEINRMMKKKQKQIVEKSAEKLANGYYPPYILAFPDTDYDSYITILYLEAAANTAEIKTQLVVLYEINCREKKFRILSTTSYKKPARPQSSHSLSEWMYAVPETRGDTLRKILCK